MYKTVQGVQKYLQGFNKCDKVLRYFSTISHLRLSYKTKRAALTIRAARKRMQGMIIHSFGLVHQGGWVFGANGLIGLLVSVYNVFLMMISTVEFLVKKWEECFLWAIGT